MQAEEPNIEKISVENKYIPDLIEGGWRRGFVAPELTNFKYTTLSHRYVRTTGSLRLECSPFVKI
jgi:hypothetical protein